MAVLEISPVGTGRPYELSYRIKKTREHPPACLLSKSQPGRIAEPSGAEGVDSLPIGQRKAHSE